MKLIKVLILVLFTYANTASGIIIKHDVNDEQYRQLAKNYPISVTFYDTWKNKEHVVGTGTYIGERWIVTAAHVAHYMKVGLKVGAGRTFLKVEKIIVHQGWKQGQSPNDIALVKLNSEPKELQAVALYQASDEVNREFTFVGRGQFGNGKVGIIHSDQQQRAARNLAVSANDQFVQFVFDSGKSALQLEGISGPGDSGGPGVISINGKLYLAGVSSWQDTSPTKFVEGKYNVIEHYTRVSSFISWIKTMK